MIYSLIWIAYQPCKSSIIVPTFNIMRKCFSRLQENNLQRIDNQLFLKLRSLKILDVSINHLSNALPLELFQSIYHIKGNVLNVIFVKPVCCIAMSVSYQQKYELRFLCKHVNVTVIRRNCVWALMTRWCSLVFEELSRYIKF